MAVYQHANEHESTFRIWLDTIGHNTEYGFALRASVQSLDMLCVQVHRFLSASDPGKGVCADPVNRAAILGKEGPDPQGRNKGRQLSPDKGREKT